MHRPLRDAENIHVGDTVMVRRGTQPPGGRREPATVVRLLPYVYPRAVVEFADGQRRTVPLHVLERDAA